MAITTNTFTINAGFARSDVITQLESAFTWLGWHGGTHTGIATGISAYSGGGDINASATYEDVRQLSTSGVGTDISFYITRDSGGLVNRVMVNRPGYGYTDGEVVTVSSEDIGTAASGASNLTVTINVEGGGTPVGYGSTNAFYDKALTAGSTYPWGVLRHTIQPNKKYGDTYRGFQVTAGGSAAAVTLDFKVGNGFHPYNTDNTADKGLYYGNRFAGESAYDLPLTAITSSTHQISSSTITSKNTQNSTVTITSSTGSNYQLDLNVYRSSIDPNFVVFSYKQPTLSSTHLTTNTDATFFFSNYTTNIWDLDYQYLSGVTEIIPTTGNTSSPDITFRTFTRGQYYHNDDRYSTVRAAEYGYHGAAASNGYSNDSTTYLNTSYASNTYPRIKNATTDTRIYLRNNSLDSAPIGSESNFNAVIKGIQLSNKMVPCPYYLPDDFVLIDFDYATDAANIQQGDTITISGSEVYTVITGSYNQTTRTRGILFCARTV